MAEITRDEVQKVLETIVVPGAGRSIVELGLVSGIFIASGKVYFSINVPEGNPADMEPVRSLAEKAVATLPGVAGVMVSLTADRKPGTGRDEPPPHVTRVSGGGNPPGMPGKPVRAGVPGVGAIVAVASGKGGVGKSTTAVNLALAMKANGLRVGILDADIYGPSMPRLLGISGRPGQRDGRIIEPMQNYGVKVMSMGFLVDEQAAMIWRGPMVQSALMQMLREVDWGELDVLVVDMPPGTGDAQLTMAQQVPLAGAVIVSTPQDLALADARKGITMFRKVEVPLLGVIENMSYFIAPDTGARYDIFGHGGARAEAERIGVPFLGEVPLTISIREHSDAGTPVVVSEPDGVQAKLYRDIAARVWATVSGGERRAAPAIVFE